MMLQLSPSMERLCLETGEIVRFGAPTAFRTSFLQAAKSWERPQIQVKVFTLWHVRGEKGAPFNPQQCQDSCGFISSAKVGPLNLYKTHPSEII